MQAISCPLFLPILPMGYLPHKQWFTERETTFVVPWTASGLVIAEGVLELGFGS